MGFRCLVRDQEVDGSNPFAPTIPYCSRKISAVYGCFFQKCLQQSTLQRFVRGAKKAFFLTVDKTIWKQRTLQFLPFTQSCHLPRSVKVYKLSLSVSGQRVYSFSL